MLVNFIKMKSSTMKRVLDFIIHTYNLIKGSNQSWHNLHT